MILHPHQNESFGYIMAAAGPAPPLRQGLVIVL